MIGGMNAIRRCRQLEPQRPLQGQVLRRSRRREVALFLHGDALWVADFIDGHGELFDAVTWVRFNCASSSSAHAQRRMVLESAVPLSDELIARIDALQRRTSQGETDS